MSFYEDLVPRLRTDSRLDTFQRALVLLLADVVDDDTGSCHMSIEELSKATHISEGKVQPSILHLDKCGYVLAEKRPTQIGHLKWHITIKGYPPYMRRDAIIIRDPIAIEKYLGRIKVSVLIEDIRKPLH